jgi:Glycosyl hydrolases family 18
MIRTGRGPSRRRLIGPIVLVAGLAVGAGVLSMQGRGGTTGTLGQSQTPTSGSLGGVVDPGPPTGPPPKPKHEVYGFIPYWEMDADLPDHIRQTDLTTVGLFSVTNSTDGSLRTNQIGYKRITSAVGESIISAAHDRGTRVEIVYSSFGAQKNRTFYDRPKAQARWIADIVAFVAAQKLDGINVDVEALPPDLVPAYGAFVGELRAALVQRVPKAQLSVATQGNEVGAAMAAAAAQAGADRIFLMGYDYRVGGSQPGATSPIARTDGEPKDLVWSLDLYAALGVPVDRTILGLPLYGMTWPVVGPMVGASSTGRGTIWVPRQNLRVFQAPSFAPTYEPTESVEFYSVPSSASAASSARPAPSSASAPGSAAALPSGSESPSGGWNAVYYDSPRSLTPKLALADARGLAGAGFWAIGYERGLPGYTELIATFKAGKLETTPTP